MNTIAVLTGQAYRAAAAVTPRGDVRSALNGIHLDTKAGKAVGTNGHILYVTDMEPGDDPGEPITFAPRTARVLAGAELVEITRHDENNVLVHVTYSRKVADTYICPIVSGPYPDYQAIKPATGVERAQVAFDVKYLALLSKIFSGGVRFEFEDGPGACTITGGPNEGTVILMEVRL